ncbi:hypothetical protein [Amycolatopsis pithecellobii]|uniref:Transcriptional regulator n=1 Tax=Amycolatopsis pithecellobii TaxID=664692 RepID=A0A6N7YT77_9PSEU|nr:hypothetical protein [Amycolatopsis pithecellobii]MTD55148.1 hypothetical protein [Amycolatopsis pithecellobii]
MQQAKQRRWAVVAVAAALLVAAPLLVDAVRPPTQSLDPGRLRELVLRSVTAPYQGHAQSTGSLGLPELPNLADVSALFSGTTSMRAWYAGPDRYRVAVLTTAGEHDIYRLPEGEYTWDYSANALVELRGPPTVRLPRASDLLPPELARWLLQSAPAQAVTTLPPRRVAGITASGLRVDPDDPDTTIGQVDVWADPVTGLPVRVEVTARGQHAPGLVTEFDEVDQTAPLVTAPQPAPGTGYSVTDAPDIASALGTLGRARLPATLDGRVMRAANVAGVQGAALYGAGLTTFAVAAVRADIARSAADSAAKAGGATVKLAGGTGVFLSIAPLSLAIVQPYGARRGYLLAGLVTPPVLQAAGDELSRPGRSSR